MADYSRAVEMFQQGSDWAQRRRANKQLETARDQALEADEYGLQAKRAFRKTQNPDAMGVLGEGYAEANTDWGGQLEDPFALKLFNFFKKKMGGKKKRGSRQAIATSEGSEYEPSSPVAPEVDAGSTDEYAAAVQAAPDMMGDVGDPQAMPEEFADGGAIPEYRNRRAASAKEVARGTNRMPPVAGAAPKAGLVRRAIGGAGRVAAPLALGATALEGFDTPTEQYRERFGLETDDPSFAGDAAVRTLGVASTLGDMLTLGQAGKLYRDKRRIAAEQEAGAVPEQELPPAEEAPRAALPTGGQGGSMVRRITPDSPGIEPDVADFGDIDIDPKEVPDMKTDDWKQYRAQMIAAAQKSGDPSAVTRVNDMVTEMQMKGFLSYGQQGLALQQAGNTRGAMAAYRAAFQYFPNGNDVEFGTNKNKRTGREQIIGFGKDEQTGKVVPGSELIMDPERVGVLLENFSNPQAFRMWTKDWRDFKQGEKRYEEVTKPLAQAQADSLANTSEARLLAAENAGLRAGGGAGGAAGLRNAERVFRERLSQVSLEDEGQADYLASIMSQIKVANPGVPDNTIMQVVMTAAGDGTLARRLQQMGIGGAPRQALPIEQGMPAGVDPEAWNDPEVAALPYNERVMVSTPAQ